MSPDGTRIPISTSDDAVAAARMLLRWVQHDAGLAPGGGRATLGALAKAMNASEGNLKKFLNQKMSNKDSEARFFEGCAPGLYDILKTHPDWPRSVLGLVEQVYGPQSERIEGQIITLPEVVEHKSLCEQSATSTALEPVFGLSLLVRIANETVPSPTEEDPDARTLGWSVSLLTVPPRFIQQGTHHPLFKLRQRGTNPNAPMDIEGTVIGQNDYIVFKGIDTQLRKPFSMMLTYSSTEWGRFRNPVSDEAHAPFVSGVMMGLSSTRTPFAGLCEIFAIPGSVLTPEASLRDREGFSLLYQKAKDATGVRTLEETVGTLAGLGIHVTQDTLIQLRTRSQPPLLKAN